MLPPLKPGVTLAKPNGPVIETARLMLRRWRAADIEPNTAMLGDPLSGRFITADNKPVTDAFAGWRNAAIMSGHWELHGIGMFVVEDRENTASQAVARRLGAEKGGEYDLFGHAADIWVTSRDRWRDNS
jgi:RimJ/RimL family protein N-acetyltransferase